MKSAKITPGTAEVIGALGTVSNKVEKHCKQTSSTITMGTIQARLCCYHDPAQIASENTIVHAGKREIYAFEFIKCYQHCKLT